MELQKKKRIYFLLYCILASILIISYKTNNPFFSYLRNEFITHTAPFLAKVSDTIFSTNEILGDFARTLTLFKENKSLKLRNDFLEFYFYRYKQILEENEELRKQLNLSKDIIYPFVTAKVIAKSNNFLHQEIIVNAGNKANIKKGQLVISNNYLIGKVISTTSDTATILLISDPDSKIPVKSLNTKIHFMIRGNSNNILSAIYLGEELPNEKEIIVTSSDSPLIIPDIVIGIIYSESGNYFLKPNIDLNTIEFVQILQPNYE